MTRALVSDDGRVRTYRVLDDQGAHIGWDQEVIPTTAEVNAGTLRRRAGAALTTNIAYLGTAAPNAAQNAAQLRAVTIQCSMLIRLLLDVTDTTDGT